MNPWTEGQVRGLEEFYGISLPQACIGFLRDDFGVLVNLKSEDANLVLDYESLKKLRKAAENMLAEEQHPFTLAPNDFVIYFRSGPRFLFFRCEPENDDPPVFSFRTGDSRPEQAFDHFSDWVQSLQAQPEEVAISLTGEPPPITWHLDLAGLITPELEAELRRMEKRFRAELAKMEPRLGSLLGAFQPATANLVAAVIFGIILLGLGTSILGWLVYQMFAVHFEMPFAAWHGTSWVMLLASALMSAGMAAVGAYLIFWAKRLFNSRLVVGAHGFSWVRPSHIDIVAWSEIREIVEVVLRESLPLNTPLRYLLPKSEGCQYEVETKDGRKLRFSANNVRGIAALRAIFERVAADLEIRWSVMRGVV
jgi:hypothetical protein